jgi:anti-anti-sigma factor
MADVFQTTERFWRVSMSQTGLATAGGIFEIEQQDDTIIVVPTVDLRELVYRRIEEGAKQILDHLNGTGIKNVVLDFHKTDYYGSTALGFFVKLWKRVRSCDGRMAFCNVSAHEKEILQVTRLDQLWPIYSSRNKALEAVRE